VAREQSDEVLIEIYRIAAAEHARATEAGDYKSGNRAHRKLADAYRKLRSRGHESQSKLLALLKDPDVGARSWAAAHALEFAPEAGEPVMEELAAGRGLRAFSSKMTLAEWRAGRLKFP